MATLDKARPLLETKLYVPKLRRGVVPRPRLERSPEPWGRVEADAHLPPAGFGKTTLLAEWLAATPPCRVGRARQLTQRGRFAR